MKDIAVTNIVCSMRIRDIWWLIANKNRLIVSCYKNVLRNVRFFNAWVASFWLRPDFGLRSKELKNHCVSSLSVSALTPFVPDTACFSSVLTTDLKYK